MKLQTNDWPGRLRGRDYTAEQLKVADRQKLQMTLASVGVHGAAPEAEITARLRIARIALAAVKRSAAGQDGLPAAIEAFAAELSRDSILDPFTGKPLRYESGAGQFPHLQRRRGGTIRRPATDQAAICRAWSDFDPSARNCPLTGRRPLVTLIACTSRRVRAMCSLMRAVYFGPMRTWTKRSSTPTVCGQIACTGWRGRQDC